MAVSKSMAILTLRDGKRYQETCPNCGGIHITDQKSKGSYVETERFVCADCGHKAVAPALDRIEIFPASRIAGLSGEEDKPLQVVPNATKDFFQEHTALLLQSFVHWTGKSLTEASLTREQQAAALFDAAFALVSHNTAADPIFNYANRQALTLFEMSWEEFTQLPSRLSAEPMHQGGTRASAVHRCPSGL